MAGRREVDFHTGVAFHRFIKSKEEEEFDVPPWEDPRTFGPGGPLHTPPKPPELGPVWKLKQCDVASMAWRST